MAKLGEIGKRHQFIENSTWKCPILGEMVEMTCIGPKLAIRKLNFRFLWWPWRKFRNYEFLKSF
jgi:hypothetical protein